jgi:hypothetical protein
MFEVEKPGRLRQRRDVARERSLEIGRTVFG